MFGISFTKILVVIAVIAAVYFTVKYLTRQAAAPKGKVREKRGAEAASAVEEMSKCRVCGAYLAPSAAACERADCPLRG